MRIIRKELAYIRALLFSGAKAYPDLCMYIYIYTYAMVKIGDLYRTWHIWPIIHIVFLTYKPLDLILQNYGNGLLLFSTIHSSLNGEVWECFLTSPSNLACHIFLYAITFLFYISGYLRCFYCLDVSQDSCANKPSTVCQIHHFQ